LARFIYHILIATLAFSFLSSCRNDKVAGTNSEIIRSFIEVSGKSTASTGTPVALKVNSAVIPGETIDTLEWVFSDGSTRTGENVSISFADAGLYQFIVKALDGTEVIAETAGLISVFDPASGANPGFDTIPTLFGDVGQDGVVELDDVLLAAQGAAGLYDLDLDAFEAADMTLSARIGLDDARLIAQMLLTGATLPSAVLEPFVYPAGVASMVSPALQDPDSTVTVTVDGLPSPQVMRQILGYASFHIPKDAVGTGAAVDVVVLVDGAEADRMSVVLKAAPTKPADAKADVFAFLDQLEGLIGQQKAATEELIGETGNLSAADSEIVAGAAEAGRLGFEAAAKDLKALLDAQNNEDLARFLQATFYANGLAEFRADLTAAQNGTLRVNGNSLSQGTPADVCAIYVPAACTLKSTSSAVSIGTNILAASCSTAALVVVVGGAISPADGPVVEVAGLAAFVKFCLPLTVPLQVAGVVGDIIGLIDLDMRITSDKTSLQQNETAEIKAEVVFIGVHNLCGVAATRGTKALITKRLGEKIVGMLMRKSTTYQLLGQAYSAIGEDAYVGLLNAISSLVVNTLDATGMSTAFGNFISNVCGYIDPGTGSVTADARDFSMSATNGGLLSFLANGTASLACPPASSSSAGPITVSGSKTLCGAAKTGSVTVGCGTGNVTITMGDNGNLNDDIYEVIIDGRTVLTSSVPVRSTSVTVQLPVGRTTVQMRGRAAPDGVGTYFISFSGARVISGQTSGSDLTPGRVKTFVIEVEVQGS
jgi:hypothetical protein